MKGSRLFIVGIVIMLLVIFAIEYRMPKKFVWNPTFAHYDEQPLGARLLDSLFATSLPSGYRTSRETFYMLNQNDSVSPIGIVVLTEHADFSELDVNTLLSMAHRGCRILIAAADFGYRLSDTLHIRSGYKHFSARSLLEYNPDNFTKESLCWIGDSLYPAAAYPIFRPFSGSALHFNGSQHISRLNREDSLHIRLLAEKDLYRNNHPLIAVARSWGKGEIILSSTPLLFTNYGVIEGNTSAYLFRLMAQLGNLPVVRTEAYIPLSAQASPSPLRYLLEHPPLRWALYLCMLAIVLFMFFTARRRVRPIPMIRPPQNRQLEFIELIGTLYSQKKDPADLVRKKFTYFAETLRREVQVDIDDVTQDSHTIERLARKTGMDAARLETFVRRIRPVIYGAQSIDTDAMKRFIDEMNNIINHI